MKKYILSSLFVLLATFIVNAQTNFYYQSGNIDNPANWNTVSNGSGTAAANFSANSQVFNITGTKILTSSSWSSSSAVWTVSGTSSKIVVGDGTNAAKLYIPAGNQIVGTVDVATLSTLQVQSTANPPFTAGTFSTNGTTSQSTLIFDGGTQQYLPGGNYFGSVSITGANTVVTMQGAIIAGNGTSSPTTAGINVATGARLNTNNFNLNVRRTTPLVASGGTIDLGSSASFNPQSGYSPSFATGSTIISSSTTGIDGNTSIATTSTGGSSWFAASGINYVFNGTNNSATTTNTSTYTVGSSTNFTVSSGTGITAGQAIYLSGNIIGYVTSIVTNTVTAVLNTSLASTGNTLFFL